MSNYQEDMTAPNHLENASSTSAWVPYQHSYTRDTKDSNQSKRNWAVNLPSLLRAIGSIAVLVSLYTFLMKGWEGSSDVLRYLMLLGHTGILSIMAFASARYFKESKSPRVLIMLSLISTVVNFAILGAFIYSTTADISQLNIPEYIVWSMNGFYNALFLSVLAMAFLVPISGFGFRILARGMSQEMLWLFLVSNICLLIPERSPDLIGLMAVSLAMLIAYITGHSARSRIEAKTFEGQFVLLLQFLPVAVLLGRSLWLHWFVHQELIFIAAISMSLFILFRQISLNLSPDHRLRSLLEFSSSILAFFTGLIAYAYLINIGFNENMTLLTSAFIASALCYDISLRTEKMSKLYHTLAIGLFSGCLVISLMVYGTGLSLLANIIAGILFLMMSYREQRLSLLMTGSALLVLSILKQSIVLMQYFDFGYWSILALSGIAIIVLASALESKGKNILNYLNQTKQSYSRWAY